MAACTTAPVHNAGEEQNGSRITLSMGDTLQVALDGNPTTGYAWEVVENNPSLLAPQGEADFRADTPVLVGSGGTFFFSFKAIARGTTPLKLIYRRPFEKDVPPIREYRLTIQVE